MEFSALTRRRLIAFGAFVSALFLGLVCSFVVERASLGEEVVRGAHLGEKAISGMSRTEVAAYVFARRKQLESSPLVFSLGEETLEVTALGAGISIDSMSLVDTALRLGSTGNWVQQFGFWLARLVSSQRIDFKLTLDRGALEKALQPWAEKHLDGPVPPSVSYQDGLQIERGRGGTILDYDALASHLLSLDGRRLGSNGEKIRLVAPTKVLPPVVPADVVMAWEERVKRLLSTPFLLVSPLNEGQLRLPVDALGAALSSRVIETDRSFVVELNTEQLHRAMRPLAEKLEKDPVDAKFVFAHDGSPSILPSEAGLSIDMGALVRDLWSEKAGEERRITLQLKEIPSKLQTEEAEKLGIKGLVGSFTTHHPCCQPRVENIHHAARQLDGVVLRPGEKFSLNELLGPRSAATGYKMAPTIVRGEMEDMYGGGISQLATTLFNAVLRGGYEIVQRQPHSVYFSRYPEGHEATVSYPEPDLIFRNDTEAGAVIKTQVSPTFVRVLIYGDHGGRVVTLNKSNRYDIARPPQEFEPDPQMDPAKVTRVSAGQLGWKVKVSRTVKFPDGREKVEKREVVYNPRPEILRVHPCKIPEGQKGHTGEECPEPQIEEREEELSEELYETL